MLCRHAFPFGRSHLVAVMTLAGLTALVAALIFHPGFASERHSRRRPPPPPPTTPPPPPPPTTTPTTPVVKPGSMVVLGFNDLGMHCINPTFGELCILPPYNNLHAQVIDRSSGSPHIVTSGVTVQYSIPGNSFSVGKTDFWNYAQKLFGLTTPLTPNIGLTGNGLTGTMTPTGNGDWAATGIPITPIDDQTYNANLGKMAPVNMPPNPYMLSQITVKSGATVTGQTAAVVPVSWEISCYLCHNNGAIVPQINPGTSMENRILSLHDLKHGTNLVNSKPVLCASCHADPALGTTGVKGVTNFSATMHGSHSELAADNRWGKLITSLGNTPLAQQVSNNHCYACHPGFVTNCLRDVHAANGMTCTDCHGSMSKVADPTRTPWVSEPSCGGCHQTINPRFAYEQTGKLFKQSRGHNGVMCASCHGSPHAVTPATTPNDNYQSLSLQGVAGPIPYKLDRTKCTICHQNGAPDDNFNHSLDD